MRIRSLITHDGKFHSDEVMSTAVLKKIFPDAEVIRTRDPEIIYRGLGRDAVVYDVGRYYEPKLFAYDHHQPNAPCRPDGTPYSAFGLIWKHHGEDYLAKIGIDSANIKDIHGRIDYQMVMTIDQMDNGILKGAGLGPLRALAIPAMIDDFSPDFDQVTLEAENEAFTRAVEFVSERIMARAKSMEADIRSNLICKMAIKEQWGRPILELPIGMLASVEIRREKADHIMMVVHPRRDDWCLAAVQKGTTPNEYRVMMPAAWAGLEKKSLAEASGVDDAIFCHQGRFVSIAKSREGIMKMAEIALEQAYVKTPQEIEP